MADIGKISIDSAIDHLPDAPVSTSRNRGWTGVTIDTHAAVPQSVAAAPAHDHHLICYCSSGSGRFIQRRAGKIHDSHISAGMSIFMPAGYEAGWEGDVPASARIRVPMELVAQAAQEIGVRPAVDVELLNNFGVRDNAIELFSGILLGELDKPPHPAQALLVDSVSFALAAHLLRNYNAFDAAINDRLPALAPKTLARIVSYVEDHMGAPIGLAELAAIAGVSRFHFTRLFKSSTGSTPMAYVERMRIARAKDLIREGRLVLADIALVVGFADQSHFTRRFHRHAGCTPVAYAQSIGVRRLSRL